LKVRPEPRVRGSAVLREHVGDGSRPRTEAQKEAVRNGAGDHQRNDGDREDSAASHRC